MVFVSLRQFACCLVAVLAVALPACALEPATPLARLGRQAWSMENGLPQNTVPVLLQSHSGYLWAGTELGLARFDGVSFHVFDHATAPPFPDAEIRCLLDAREGKGNASSNDDLWVGTADGLAHWKNSRWTVLTTGDGLPGNSVRGLAQTADGAIWAWTEDGLARWTGERFVSVSLANGQPGSEITSIAADAQGTLWVGTAQGVATLREGRWRARVTSEANTGGLKNAGRLSDHLDHSDHARAAAFKRASLVVALAGGDVLMASDDGVFVAHGGSLAMIAAPSALPEDGVSFLARLAGGAFAIASKSTVILTRGASVQAAERFFVSRQLPGSRIDVIYADREGCLWVGTNRGLAHISPVQSAVQLMPPTDPLATNAIVTLLEDREGDMWVGTEAAGLHILRDARFHMLSTSDGLSSDAATAVVEDAHHDVWVGTKNSGLNRIAGGRTMTRTTTLTTANGLLSNVILSLAVSKDALWVGTPDGLNRIDNRGVTSITSGDGLPDDFVRSLLVEPDDSLWIGTRRGLTRLQNGRFETMTQANGLGSDLVGALARTDTGDLWIATLNGLTRLRPGAHAEQLHNYTTRDGLSSNVITALEAAPHGMVWIGTQGDGLNLWDGNQFRPVRRDGTDALPAAIHAIVQDSVGHLWLASDAGITRADTQSLIDCAQGRACNLDASHVVHFTTADGLRSRETSSNSHPTVLRASDGQLWFTSPRGVAIADPLHFPANPLSPPVAIERFAVDDLDQGIDAGRAMRIGAGHLRFQFDYAGLSFASPQKVHYQCILEGFDRGWTDVGTRRTAYYTNIPSGPYRFRVRAVMDETGLPVNNSAESTAAALAFVLLPHFYQTFWFRALIVAAVAAIIVLVFRRRVLRVEREFRAVMAERNRIAREIHDTLAQGYVGISLQLEILGQLLRHKRTDAAVTHLAMTQELVREGLDDARQSIWALRSQDAGEQTLPIRVRRLVEQAADEALSTDLEVHGAYRPLVPETEKEVLRIVQEAIQNVKRHAEASSMKVRLEYDERALAVTVSDNGKGFVKQLEKPATAGGHYGLTGMHERAALIEGTMEISSEPGHGTTVRLHVPARGRGIAMANAQAAEINARISKE